MRGTITLKEIQARHRALLARLVSLDPAVTGEVRTGTARVACPPSSPQIEAILLQAERTRAARAKAEELGDANLLHIAGCAEAQGQAQLQAMADALAPMNALTSALSLFLGLLGLPEVPALDGLIDVTNPDAGLAAIDALIDMLRGTRDSVPLP